MWPEHPMHDIKSWLSFCRSRKSTHVKKNCGGREVLYANVVRHTMVSKFQPNGYCQVLKPLACFHIGKWIHQPIIMLTSKIQPDGYCPLRATCIGSPWKMDSSAYNTIYLVSPSKVAMYIHNFGRDLRGGGT